VPNSYNLKIQDGGGRHREFGKNVNNSGLDKDKIRLCGHEIFNEIIYNNKQGRHR